MRRTVIGLLALAVACSAAGREPSSTRPAGPGLDGNGNPPLPLAPGQNAPAFRVDSLATAAAVTIAPGKVTLVDFWATWNEPAKKSFPKLEELRLR